MAIDGTFIHYLTDELSSILKGGRVQKVNQLNNLEFIFEVRSGGANHHLLISSALNAPRIHLTETGDIPISEPQRLGLFLKKNLERAVISDLSQIGNDRCIKIEFDTTDDFGDAKRLWLFLEIMGRNSNLVITNEDYEILEAARYLPPSAENYRIIIPRAKYVLPYQENTVNPFLMKNDEILYNFSGVSKLMMNEFHFRGSVKEVINQPVRPTLINTGQKVFFYAYDLLHLNGERTSFPTLSQLLDHIYGLSIHESSVFVTRLKQVIKRYLKRANQKLANLRDDLLHAHENLAYQKLGELLQSHLYLAKKGDESITVIDYYNDNKELTISLDPTLSPSENLNDFFKKAKKAKTAIGEINGQISLTKDEIDYLELIDFQIDHANSLELKEIEDELITNNYIKPSKKKRQKLIKSKIDSYKVDNAIIYVGKNNYQNNYLTNKFASPKDFFFHVKDYPGAHVIVRCDELTETIIRTAAMLAGANSKSRHSSSIPVDYTSIKNVKKIPKTKGYQVTYKNQKTIYIDIDEDYLKKLQRG